MFTRSVFATAVTPILLLLCGLTPGDPPPPADPKPDEDPISAPILGLRGVDLEGAVHAIGDARESRGAVLVFMSTDCPISNQYIPELNRLAAKATTRALEFYGVLSDPYTTRNEARAHSGEYAIDFPMLLDTTGEIARRLQPTHTPEAFVLRTDGYLAYRGRIDDRFASLGEARARVSERELIAAIATVAAGRANELLRTQAVGCDFEPWQPTPAEEEINYARHVAPILNAHCASCHHEGGIGPFALTDYRDAKRRARMIARVTEDGYMPPWHPEPGYGEFRGKRKMSSHDIAMLRAWADSGAPLGEMEESPPAPRFDSGWQLGEPDLVLEIPEPFEIPPEGEDIYRCFVLPTGLEEDVMVVATEFKPGAPSVVHHAIHYLDGRGQARRLDARQPGPGYSRFGGPGFAPSGTLGGWAPGYTARYLPDGTGRLLRKGTDVVVQVHYHPNGKREHDLSRLALYFAPREGLQGVRDFTTGTLDIDIPPGESSHRIRTQRRVPYDMNLIAAIPHMHLLGKEMKATAKTPDGETVPLIWVREYDFDWQDQYPYTRPVFLPKGSVITVEARYDNSEENPRNPSSPPRRVRYGEGTNDEMCFCFFWVVRANR